MWEIDAIVNPSFTGLLSPTTGDSANPLQVWLYIGGIVWLTGMIIFLLYGIFSFLRLKGRLSEAAPADGYMLCDHVKTPFIIGILRPRIYLPSSIREADIPYVIAHVNAHLKRKDYLWKLIGFLLLSVYWFHPMVWVSYVLFGRDIECACDESVISAMDQNDRNAYADALEGNRFQQCHAGLFPGCRGGTCRLANRRIDGVKTRGGTVPPLPGYMM